MLSTEELEKLEFLHSRPAARSLKEYENTLLRYVETKYDVTMSGCRMSDLNRRFALLGKEYGLRPMQVCFAHAKAGDLILMRHGRNLIALPNAFQHDLAKIAMSGDMDGATAFQQVALDKALAD